jgi:hypothetical protein
MHGERLGNVVLSFCEHGFSLRHDEANLSLLFILTGFLHLGVSIQRREQEGRKEQIPPGTKITKMKGHTLKLDVGSSLDANEGCVPTCMYMQAHASALHGDV